MNPEQNNQQGPNEKRLLATAMVLDDVVLAGILMGGAAAVGMARGSIKGGLSAMMRKSGSLSRFKRLGKKGAISVFIAATLLAGSAPRAFADNRVVTNRTTPVSEKVQQLRSLTDYVSGIYDTKDIAKKNASDMLFETAVHESQRLTHKRQVIKQGKVLVEKGRARSIFMVEPITAKNLVRWASTKPRAMNLLTTTSGLTAKELTAMTRQQLADFMMQHDHFAAAIARVKYLSVPGKIPSTAEARAVYWGKWYQGTNNPVKQQQYLRDNRLIAEEVKASALSNVVQKHIEVKPTQGLVNKVLHEGKIMHNVASKTKKASRMWRIFGGR
jgi:hypothetical protein